VGAGEGGVGVAEGARGSPVAVGDCSGVAAGGEVEAGWQAATTREKNHISKKDRASRRTENSVPQFTTRFTHL